MNKRTKQPAQPPKNQNQTKITKKTNQTNEKQPQLFMSLVLYYSKPSLIVSYFGIKKTCYILFVSHNNWTENFETLLSDFQENFKKRLHNWYRKCWELYSPQVL